MGDPLSLPAGPGAMETVAAWGQEAEKSGRAEVRWERTEPVLDTPVAPERSHPVSLQTEAFSGGGCMAPIRRTDVLAGELR